MVECLTGDPGAAGLNLTGVMALWSLSMTHPSSILVPPRKTRPCLIERLLMGCKESNQTKSFLLASAIFYHQLITFANRLDPDQDRQNVGPDLDANCLTL